MTHADLQVREAARDEIRAAVQAVRDRFPEEFAKAQEETGRHTRAPDPARRTLSQAVVAAFQGARRAVGLS